MLKIQGNLRSTESPAASICVRFRCDRPLMNTANLYAKKRHSVPFSVAHMSSSSSHPAASISPALSHAQARSLALAAEFSEAGLIALPHGDEARDAARFEQWIGQGNAGSMHYLERKTDDGQLVRARVANPFPWARSAIVCFANYDSAQPRSIDPAANDAGWIARYASTSKQVDSRRQPSDYHKVLKRRLDKLETDLHASLGAFEARAYVDTGPVVERSLAVAAGLGWTGKNTCLIHPKLGSFGFLAVLLTELPVTNAELPAALVEDRCGTCRRCIEACPTNALAVPYRMDATRCISYLTIEHKGPIAPELMNHMGRQVFGCDICQDVCPWNRRSNRTLPATDPDLAPRPELVNPALDWLASLTQADSKQLSNGSPIRRSGFLGLQRNIAIAIGNSGLARFTPQLETWAASANEALRTAAQWALQKLRAD
jgi:epoxyqueuosine reductase